MKYTTIFFTATLFAFKFSSGQIIEKTYPKTFWSENDTVTLVWQNFPEDVMTTQVSKYPQFPTQNFNTQARPGLYMTLYFGRDSLRIFYSQEMPTGEYVYVPFQSPKGKTQIRIGFETAMNYFPSEYVRRYTGKVQILVPEVYELANIIWTLSPTGGRAKDLYKEGEYYERVVQHFKAYRNHPVFKQLDFPDSLYFEKYYSFRDNSLCYQFKGDGLVAEGPYYYVFGRDWNNHGSQFKDLLELIANFAKKSDFRSFYRQNLAFYEKEIQRQKELLPVKSMWAWLEKNFPTRYDSYKIVFSPLILGSHSTQNFWEYGNVEFGETVMFICGPDRYDNMKDITEKQKEGLMSGIVFTEIDHNYVNPVTSKYNGTVDSIFKNRDIWAKPGNNSGWYGSPVSVFNEYMTHALFCLWVMDEYDTPTADFVIERREQMMVERRNFIRFKEFNKALIKIRQANRDKQVVDLYPEMLAWCKEQR